MTLDELVRLSKATVEVQEGDSQQAAATGPGKRSTEDIWKADAIFLQQTCSELIAALSLGALPFSNEDELVKFTKKQLKEIPSVKNKAQQKFASGKRRKGPTEEVTQQFEFVERLVATAALFQRIYTELSTLQCNALELDKHMTKAESAGYTFTPVANVKRRRGICMESIRFGKYDDLATLLAAGEHIDEILKSDTDLVDRVFMMLSTRNLTAGLGQEANEVL